LPASRISGKPRLYTLLDVKAARFLSAVTNNEVASVWAIFADDIKPTDQSISSATKDWKSFVGAAIVTFA